MNHQVPVPYNPPPGFSEANIPASLPGGLVLSREQRAIVEAVGRLEAPGVLSVQAFAGTAKTTTARAIVASLRHKHILYLVFNKDMQLEAKEAMKKDMAVIASPYNRLGNFDVLTTHGLARKSVKYEEHFAANRWNGDLPISKVRAFLVRQWNPSSPKDVKYAVAAAVRCALNRYMTSGDEELFLGHFSAKQLEKAREPLQSLLSKRRSGGNTAVNSIQHMLLEAARMLWSKLISRTETELPLPHNAYLKLCTLQKPKLVSFRQVPYDLIIVDEAQDLNAVTKQLVMDLQEESPLVLLGDKHQQIYSFNYACGLLSGRVHFTRPLSRLSLRQSYRFGSEIAAAINAVLKAAFKEGDFLIGREQQTASDPRVHPGVVYCLLPQDRDLTTVTLEDIFPPRAQQAQQPQVQPEGRINGNSCGASSSGSGSDTQGLNGASSSGSESDDDGDAAAGAAPRRPFRFLQCPIRGLQPDEGFPLELSMTSPVPGAGVAVLPASLLLPGAPRPRVTLVARRNATLVLLALQLVTAGHTVCASFQQKDDSDEVEGHQDGGGRHQQGRWQQYGRQQQAGGAGGGGRRGGGAILQRMTDVYEFMYHGKRFGGVSHVLSGIETQEELLELVDSGADMELCGAYQVV
ncbi:hypothetical protein Agub_g4505, partial [Astrephomene gubernaculifera]